MGRRSDALDWIAVALLGAALIWRWWLSGQTYLELDEAFHARLSVPPWPALWREALQSTHPPLLILVLHGLRKIGTAEPLLRAPAVLAGALFPWFIYRWTGLVWSRRAGFAALAILALSPMLAHLGAVVRAYTLSLFFWSLALWCLEKALRPDPTRATSRGAWWMAGFGVALWLAVLSEYAAAFFCGAAGVYVLLRWREPAFGTNAKAIWGASQAVCLATYAYLFVVQIAPLRESHQTLVVDASSYLGRLFPQPGESILHFAAVGTMAQFDLVFSWRPLAAVAAALFAGGLVLAARRRWKLAVLLTTPFVLACAGAFTRTYPYGLSRQTIFLAVFIAVGAGIAIDRLLPKGAVWAAAVALAVAPFWLTQAGLPPAERREGQSRELMREMAAAIRRHVPVGSWMLVEGDLHMVLLHYLGGEEWPGEWRGSAVMLGGYWLWGPPGEWQGTDHLRGAAARYRDLAGISGDERIWVVDAGARCATCGEAVRPVWRHRDRAVVFVLDEGGGR